MRKINLKIWAKKNFRWFYLIAVLGGLAWSSGLALASVPAYEKKVNWNVAVFLVDYEDIPAEHRSQWPTALEWERLIFHDNGDKYNLQDWLKTISNDEFMLTGDVFDYTTSTATYWDNSGILLDSGEVVDAVDFQVPGFDPDNYDLFIINSGHDAALGGARTDVYKVKINGSTIDKLSLVSFFQIGVLDRSTDNPFTNTLVEQKAYLIPQDDGTTLEDPVVYGMSAFMSTLAHEFGHSLGIGAHANSSTNGRKFDYEMPEVPFNPDKDDSYYLNFEYGNAYDIMGGKLEYAVSLNGQFRNVAGLLPQEDIATFSKPGTFTTTLHPINSTGPTRFAEVLLPFNESVKPYKNNGYGLEVRDVNWMDKIFDKQADVNLAGNLDGVFVIKTQGLLNRLLDMSPSPNIKMEWGDYFYDIRDVVLKPGMVYENDEVKFYDVVNHGDGSFSVTVDIKSDKAWTPTPDQFTVTPLPSGQVRLDWVNHHVGSGSTGMIQILARATGSEGWQKADTVANDASSYLFPFTFDPDELWEYTIYVLEDADHFRSLNSNIDSFGCNLAIASLIERHISCAGETDGEVEVLISGGSPPYEYALVTGTAQASNILTGLAPGSHSVQVTDSNQCKVSATTSPIVEPRAIAIELKSSETQTEVLANYGSGLYEYSVDETNWYTDAHLDLGPDVDTVYVRDQNDCIASRSTAPLDCSYTVSQPNGGETWYQGETNLINWVGNGADCSPAVDLKLYKAGVPDHTIATNTSDTSFAWTIPTTQDAGTEFKIRVIDARAPDIFGQSSSDFTISKPACNSNTVSGVTESKGALHEACEKLIIGPSFIAEDGASIILSSGLEIEIMPGFLINKGATLDADVCGQSLCETSPSPMPQGCHSCVVQICDIDPHCCDIEFDRACLQKVNSVCGLLCK